MSLNIPTSTFFTFALSFLVGFSGASGAPSPAVAQIPSTPGTTSPDWLSQVKQEGGSFADDPGYWTVEDSAVYGQGRLHILLDRNQIDEDLAMVLSYHYAGASDVAVQLWDAENRVVAIDLFANVVEVAEHVGTDTLIVPLRRYPSATQIVVRRLDGGFTVDGILLFPVVTEAETDNATLRELAEILGDPLSPHNPVIHFPDRPNASTVADYFETLARLESESELWIDGRDAGADRRLTALLNELTRQGVGFNADDFVQAAVDGRVNLLGTFIAAGMPTTVTNDRGMTALAAALADGEIASAARLLAAGAPIDQELLGGRTALWFAAFNCQRESVAFLLENGANPNHLSETAGTALHAATSFFNSSAAAIIDLLAEAGADLNARNGAGETPLGYIARAGMGQFVGKLIGHGADPSLRDQRGMTPMDHANANRGGWVGHALENEGFGTYDPAPVNEAPIFQACRKRDIEAIQSLLDTGTSTEVTDAQGRTPLWRAASPPWGRAPREITTLLLDYGADPNHVDGNGRTLLHHLWVFGNNADNVRLYETLLEGGADPNLRDHRGRTAALHLAGRGGSKCLRLLIAHGADLSLADDNGSTPLEEAKESGHDINVALIEGALANRTAVRVP